MNIELGHYALILAAILSLFQCTFPLWGYQQNDRRLMSTASPVALLNFCLILGAFCALAQAYVTSDFSLKTVVENSHSAKPLLYKITGIWGNHEGSMLLWVLILSFFGALLALLRPPVSLSLTSLTLAFQGLIGAGFLFFILLTSNPFLRLATPPLEGRDLNPILQDLGLAIHPPLLYLGYVGFSITFSFAMAALVTGEVHAKWAKAVHPWNLFAFIALTLGIAMGSYWAYYTLGWGGFWFWDPVENVSLMPWLSGTALLHSARVMEKRHALKIWTIFLSILTFSLSLLGTFLVRSGLLTSVHAFASDPERGLFILLLLSLFVGGAFTLFLFRVPHLKPGGVFAPLSKEGALVINNLFLLTACVTILIGTLYPLILEALTEEKISVGPPFFHFLLLPLLVPTIFLMPAGQLLAFKRGDGLGVAQRLVSACVIGFFAALAIYVYKEGPLLATLGVGLAIFLICASFYDPLYRILGTTNTSWTSRFSRALGVPLSTWGSAFAHAGFGVFLLGLSATGWHQEKITTLTPGSYFNLGPWQILAQERAVIRGSNFDALGLHLQIRSGGQAITTLTPLRKHFSTRQTTTSEIGLATLETGQIYVALADQNQDGSFEARLYWKPLVTWIWMGGILIAFGAFLSLLNHSHQRLSHTNHRTASKSESI